MKTLIAAWAGFLLAGYPLTSTWAEQTPKATTEQQRIALGKLIFHDGRLSTPGGQSCANCHRADAYYSDPGRSISPGAKPTLFGNRNTPSIAYAKFSPARHWNADRRQWVGGLFFDGRARDLVEQAADPLLNPLHMGNSSKAAVVARARFAPYAALFEELYGKATWNSVNTAFDALVDAIVAYQMGPEFGLFTSRYDAYLRGDVSLSPLEAHGLELFEAKDKGNCAACHPSRPAAQGTPTLFTDFSYHNIGLPGNADLPFLRMPFQYNSAGTHYTDPGLGGNGVIDNADQQLGKFKVPTLRNIAQTGPYMHHGVFNTLDEVLDFYSNREVQAQWGEAETPVNINRKALGSINLNDDERSAIVAFLNTLTDGWD